MGSLLVRGELPQRALGGSGPAEGDDAGPAHEQHVASLAVKGQVECHGEVAKYGRVELLVSGDPACGR